LYKTDDTITTDVHGKRVVVSIDRVKHVIILGKVKEKCKISIKQHTEENRD